MIRATIILLLWGVWTSTTTVYTQSLERFRPQAPVASHTTSELRTRATILDLYSHTRGIYVCTARSGCFLLPVNQPEYAFPVVAAQDRQDRFGPILILDGVPHVVINGYQVQSLLNPAAARWNLVPAQVASTVSPVDYAILPDGRLALATARDGVFLYAPTGSGQQFETVPRRLSTIKQELPSNQINCLQQDRDGILWIGTAAGLAAFWQDSVYNLAQSPAPDRKPTLWERFLGRAPAGPATYNDPVTAIGPWGNSLIFASDKNLYKTRRKLAPLTQVHCYTGAPDGAFTVPVNDLSVSWDGQVWMATTQLVHYNIATDSWRLIATNGGGRNDTAAPVNCLLQDDQAGFLWVGSSGRGLQRLPLLDEK